MDFGKFKYESDMKAREARRNQTNTVLKEIRFRLKIDPHDYGTKKGHVERFLKAGDKVKVMIMFRGREQSRPEMGIRLLQRLAEDVAELGFVESSPKQDGRNMTMVLGPTKKKTEAKSEQRRRAEGAEPKLTKSAAKAAAAAAEAQAASVPAPVSADEKVSATTPIAAEPIPATETVAASAPAAEVAETVAEATPIVAVKPVAAKPAAVKPVAAKPAAVKPAAAKPVAAKPAAAKPAAAKPAAVKPAAAPKPAATAKPAVKPTAAAKPAAAPKPGAPRTAPKPAPREQAG